MLKTAIIAILLCTLTVLAGSIASAYMPPGCRMAFELRDARPFVDPGLAPSQLTAAEAARFHHLPANGMQKKIFLLARGYLRLCQEVIDGRMKSGDLSADDIEWVEAVGAHDLTPPERAIFQRAAARSRRAADTGPVRRCEEALMDAVDAPPPGQPAKSDGKLPH